MGERSRPRRTTLGRSRAPFRTRGGLELTPTAGMLAARNWLTARRIAAPALLRWYAEITLDVIEGPARLEYDERTDTRFRIEVYSEEWGFVFCHEGRASWIRVTDIPFVHGRDDFRLLDSTPALKDLALLVRMIERQHGLRFRRELAAVRTNLPDAEPAIRAWVLGL